MCVRERETDRDRQRDRPGASTNERGWEMSQPSLYIAADKQTDRQTGGILGLQLFFEWDKTVGTCFWQREDLSAYNSLRLTRFDLILSVPQYHEIY